MRIIRALERDYPRLEEIWERAVRGVNYFWSEEDLHWYKSQIRSRYLPGLELFGAWIPNSADPEIEGELCGGFIGLGPQFDLSQDPGGAAKSGAQIFMLFVDPALHRHGVGQALLDYAIKIYSNLNLEVYERNEDVQNFYLHRGFRVTGGSDTDFEGKPYPVIYMKRGC